MADTLTLFFEQYFCPEKLYTIPMPKQGRYGKEAAHAERTKKENTFIISPQVIYEQGLSV